MEHKDWVKCNQTDPPSFAKCCNFVHIQTRDVKRNTTLAWILEARFMAVYYWVKSMKTSPHLLKSVRYEGKGKERLVIGRVCNVCWYSEIGPWISVYFTKLHNLYSLREPFNLKLMIQNASFTSNSFGSNFCSFLLSKKVISHGKFEFRQFIISPLDMNYKKY